MDPRLFITHDSAIDYWRALRLAWSDAGQGAVELGAGSDAGTGLAYARVKSLEHAAHTRREIARALSSSVLMSVLPSKWGGLFDPARPEDAPALDIAVASASERSGSVHVRSHVMTGAIPAWAYCRDERCPDVRVASPEMCLVQVAASMSVAQLALLAYEFCGAYACLPGSCGGDGGHAMAPTDTACPPGATHLYSVRPLTSVDVMRRHLRALNPSNGTMAAKALRALEWVLDGVASPLQAMCAVQLIMPARLGGFGLPRMLLNPPIGPRGEVVPEGNVSAWVHPDMYWPSRCLAVELDGEQFRCGESRRSTDQRRQEALEASGVRLMRLPYERFASVDRFHVFARELAAALGARRRVRDRLGFIEARDRLRADLIFTWQA